MKSNIFIIIILSAILSTSCVSLKQHKELQTKFDQCDSERELLKSQNQKLSTEVTELNDKLASLTKTINQLKADTTSLGASFRRMQELYEKASDMNRELSENQAALIKGSAAESKKLLAELQKTQEDLQKKEDELRELEKNLDIKKKNLAELQEKLDRSNQELEQRTQRLNELERTLAAKDSTVKALRDKVATALNQFSKDGLTVEMRNGKVYVSLEEKLLFKTGKWDIDPKGVQALKKLGSVLEQNQDINVMIEGHTDDVPLKGSGDIKDNWDLSAKRATSIVRILTDGTKINPQRLMATGRGEYMPLDKAKTTEARQKNRRTEIILTPKLDELFKILETN